jgi:nitrogenase molybdenum-iron protein beta chain
MAALHDRNGCALQGAALLLETVEGVVPVLHANAGCSVAFGQDGATRANEVASTALLEKQVVFGGTSRLREQIKNTFQVRAGAVFVVLSGCVPEVIGDDVPAMVKEAREQRFPVLGIAVPGFRGHAWSGHAAAAHALLEQLPASLEAATQPAVAADINLLGIAPGLDPTWEGDLIEIEAVLAELGLRANRLVGHGQGVAHWLAAPQARLNLVLSPWGAEAAAGLHRRHEIPCVDLGWLPVGSLDAGALLAQVGRALGIDAQAVAAARARLDARLRRVLRGAAGRGLLDDLQRRAAIVGGSAGAVGQSRFLAGTLGLLVVQVVITDEPPPERRAALAAAVREAAGSTAEVAFLSSRHAIELRLRAAAPELIVGSAFEEGTARALGAAFVEAAAPLRRRPVLGRSHAGVGGAVTLLEELIAALREPSAPIDAPARPTAGARAFAAAAASHASVA